MTTFGNMQVLSLFVLFYFASWIVGATVHPNHHFLFIKYNCFSFNMAAISSSTGSGTNNATF